MNHQPIKVWLAKHGIIMEESFVHALTGMAAAYQQQKGIRNLDEVYKLIGVRKQLIAYWRRNSGNMDAPSSTGIQSAGTQTKNF